MDRTNFYKVNTVTNVNELDFLNNSLSNFTMSYEVDYYRVSASDVMCPDMISKKVYGVEQFWWVICLVNNIVNPLLDIKVGTILKIPNKLDIYSFQRKYRLRRSL